MIPANIGYEFNVSHGVMPGEPVLHVSPFSDHFGVLYWFDRYARFESEMPETGVLWAMHTIGADFAFDWDGKILPLLQAAAELV